MRSMIYLIHKSLDLTAEDINDSIENCYEFDGVEISLHRDGPTIIAEPIEIANRDVKRNMNDYRIETLLNNMARTKIQ